jgi:glycosyltransferase involved in cell wall biosynthesis
MVGDIYLAFAEFVRTLPIEKKNKCVLVLHTHPVDNDGTDLYALQKDLFPDVKVLFSDKKYPPQILNYLYNTADVTINLASNEGYGIATAESLMAGTPIIINVTGGLQDQAGYKGTLNQEAK